MGTLSGIKKKKGIPHFSPCSLLTDLFNIFMCFCHFFFLTQLFCELTRLFLKSPQIALAIAVFNIEIKVFPLHLYAFFNFFFL